MQTVEDSDIIFTYKRLACVYAYPARRDQTQVTDGKGDTLFFESLEDATLRVVQGEASLNPVKPVDPVGGGVLLACIKVRADQTDIVASDVDTSTRDELVKVNSLLSNHKSKAVLDHPDRSVIPEHLDREYMESTGGAMAGILGMGMNRMYNIAYPVNSTDLARKDYVDSGFSVIQDTLALGGMSSSLKDIEVVVSEAEDTGDLFPSTNEKLLFGVKIVIERYTYKVNVTTTPVAMPSVSIIPSLVTLSVLNTSLGTKVSKKFNRVGALRLRVLIPTSTNDIIARIFHKDIVSLADTTERLSMLATASVKSIDRGNLQSVSMLIGKARLEDASVKAAGDPIYDDTFTDADNTSIDDHVPKVGDISLVNPVSLVSSMRSEPISFSADTFSRIEISVPLDEHVGESGNNWTKISGDVTVDADLDRAIGEGESTTHLYLLDVDPPSADYEVQTIVRGNDDA